MSKLKTYKMVWGMPTDPDVVTVYLRFAEPPAVIDYNTPHEDIGKVSEIDLPRPGMPLIDGQVSLGISTVDDVGNESDISVITVPFDLVAPLPVTDLRML